ncbi:MAG: H-NS family nucleoid-associated regulatory protein [Pseudomonadota bacterium]
MAVNLNNLSVQELENVIVQANELIEAKREQAVAKARADIEKIAAGTGYSVSDLLGLRQAPGRKARARKGTAAADKYRNPKDPSQTWSGRGKRPRWLQEMLEKGAKLESFLVKQAAARRR